MNHRYWNLHESILEKISELELIIDETPNNIFEILVYKISILNYDHGFYVYIQNIFNNNERIKIQRVIDILFSNEKVLISYIYKLIEKNRYRYEN